MSLRAKEAVSGSAKPKNGLRLRGAKRRKRERIRAGRRNDLFAMLGRDSAGRWSRALDSSRIDERSAR